MPKFSSQEPALVGSIVSNDCSAQRIDEWPSKHTQAGRGAMRQCSSSMPKVCCNDYNCNSSSLRTDGWNKAVILAQKKDSSTKEDAAGWPRWETTSSQSYKQHSRSADTWDSDPATCKRGWNDSKDSYATRVTGEGSDAIYHDVLDGRRQSSRDIHIVDKGSLSKSTCWNRSVGGNEKQETVGRPGDMYTTTRQFSSPKSGKGCWNQSKGRTTSADDSTASCKKSWNESGDGKKKREDSSDAFIHDGRDGWNQPSSKIDMVDKGSLCKSASWDRAKDDNVKPENDGWPRWPGAMSKTNRQYTSDENRRSCWNQFEGRITSEVGSTMSCKRGWEESGDGKEKREAADVCDAFDVVDKGSLTKSASWDRAGDDNVKRENDGWLRWPGTMSKTIGQFPSNQNKKDRLQSQWTASVESDLQKEPVGRNPDFVQSGYARMQRGSVMSPKCDRNKPITWNASRDNSFGRDHRKWDPDLDKTSVDPWKQISPTAPPNAGRRKFSQNENFIRRKCKGSVNPDFSDPYASMQYRSRCGASMSSANEQCPSSQNRKGAWNQIWGRAKSEYGDSLKDYDGKTTDLDQSDDQWMQHRSMLGPTSDWNKSSSWAKSVGDSFHSGLGEWGPGLDQNGHDPWEQISHPESPKSGRDKFGSLTLVEDKNSVGKKNKLCVAPDFGDPETLRQLPKNSRKRLFRGRSTSPSNAWEHECIQSNDTNEKVAGGAPEYYGDSPSGRSQRGSGLRHHIGNAGGKHPNRETEEFWDTKPAHLGHDRRIRSFDDPWNQKDHLHDRVSWRHGSLNKGAEKNKLFQNDTSCDGFLWERCRHHDDRECPVNNKSREISHDTSDSDPCFGSYLDSRRDNHVPSEDSRELDVQFLKEFHSSHQIKYDMLQNKSSDDKCDQKNTGKLSSLNDTMVLKTSVRDSQSQSHLRRDDEGFRDDTNKSMFTTTQNVEQKVGDSPNFVKSQQNPPVCRQSTQSLRTNDQTEHTCSPIQFGQSILVSPRFPSRAKSSNSNDQRLRPASHPKDEVQNHEQQQTMLNGESSKKSENILYTLNTQELNVQANEDPSPSNLCSTFSPAIIGEKTSKSLEKVKVSSKKLEPVSIAVAQSDGILGTSTDFVKQEARLTSRICDSSRIFIETCHSEPAELHAYGEGNGCNYEKGEVGANGELKGRMDDKSIRMFKFALAEFVKEIIKPVWKEGRLSKEAHKTLVKKVVDKVVGVLGPNIPQTQERIDIYMLYAKDKLHKLVQDYLEMFVNT